MFGKKMSGEYRTQRGTAKPPTADIALYCALFGSVFAFGLGPDFERAKQLCIAIAAALFAACVQLAWHSRAARWLVALSALLIVASTFSLDPARAWFGSLERSQGLLGYLPLLVIAAARVRWHHLVRAVVLSVLVLAVWAWAEHLAWPPFAPPGVARSYASFGNPNAFAGWLIMAIPLCAAGCWSDQKSWRSLSALALLLAISALWLSQSRAAALGLLGGLLLWYTWRARPQRRRMWARGGLSACLLVFTLWNLSSFRPDANNERLKLWQNAWSVLTAPTPSATDPYPALRPWLGYGADHQAALLHAADGVIADRAHNLLLDTLLQFGLLGTLGLAVLAVVILRRCWLAPPGAESAARLVGLSAALITWQFGFPLSAELLLLTLLLSARSAEPDSLVPSEPRSSFATEANHSVRSAPNSSVRPEPVAGQQPNEQRWRIPVVVFALGLALYAYAPWPTLPLARTPERAYQQFKAGTQAYQRADYRQAVKHFAFAQQLDPLRADYRAARATAQRMQARKQVFPAPQRSVAPTP